MNKRFCIFDMDGTLVDSMSYWKRLGREFLTQKGVTGEIDSVLERIKPMTMQESAALFLESFPILSGTPDSLADEMNAVMDAHYRDDVPLKPGADRYLHALHQRGVTLCVATATAEPLARACLTRLGVMDDLSFLLSCDEVGAGKDRPAVFLEAARRLGAAPPDIAAFEDALYAARTAKEAGFYTVGVYDIHSDRHWSALSALADETISDWNEAISHIS